MEHMRLAQWDILEYCRKARHRPEGHWPKEDAPPSAVAWQRSVEAFRRDLEAMMQLVADPATNLLAAIPHGDGQKTILREAMLLADHNAYHLGQLVIVRRLLGAWEG